MKQTTLLLRERLEALTSKLHAQHLELEDTFIEDDLIEMTNDIINGIETVVKANELAILLVQGKRPNHCMGCKSVQQCNHCK